jgi:hypothetical protein
MKAVAGKSGNWIFTDAEGFDEIEKLNLVPDFVMEYRHLYLNRAGRFFNPRQEIRASTHVPDKILTMQKAGNYRLVLLAAPLLFLLFSAPSALDYVFHYPDEKYYTDAVLQMMEKGDIFTPYQADGTPRFKKPSLLTGF